MAERKHKEKMRSDNASLRAPELKAYQDYLGLKIMGVRSDEMKFSFVCIDNKNWDREFWFVVNVSDVYRVVECEPFLPDMKVLEEQLNRDQDFYNFVRNVRQAFVRLSAQ
jgi:kinetochore protein Spc25